MCSWAEATCWWAEAMCRWAAAYCSARWWMELRWLTSSGSVRMARGRRSGLRSRGWRGWLRMSEWPRSPACGSVWASGWVSWRAYVSGGAGGGAGGGRGRSGGRQRVRIRRRRRGEDDLRGESGRLCLSLRQGQRSKDFTFGRHAGLKRLEDGFIDGRLHRARWEESAGGWRVGRQHDVNRRLDVSCSQGRSRLGRGEQVRVDHSDGGSGEGAGE